MDALAKFSIQGSEKSFYIPDFITNAEEDYLIRKIKESPQHKWKNLANRRLQVWGGELTTKNVLLTQGMPPFLDTYPDILPRLKATGAFNTLHGGPNHVILNEYLPGQGIMPHEDGPSYHPVVATVSLGSHTVFNYYGFMTDKTEEGKVIDQKPVLSVLLERRSAIITTSALYTSHLHGIEEVEEDVFVTAQNSDDPPQLAHHRVPIANWDKLTGEEVRRVVRDGGVLKRGIRYSLTCRDIAKVANTRAFGKR